MVPKPDVSEERKQQILQAAMTCFARTGYYRTTMDDIVAESGLSKGALYWYFSSKKELFIFMIQELMGQMGVAWQAIADQPGATATDKLLGSLELFRTGLSEFMALFGVMMEAWALTRFDQDVQELLQDFYKPFLQLMAGIIEEGIASGEFLPVPAEDTALVIMTMFDGITLAFGMGFWTENWDGIIDAAANMVLRGLGVQRD